MFKPSKYQQAVFDKIKNSNDNLFIEACAGSGKTTTIVEALKLIPPTNTVLFIAFGKAIADELNERVPKHVMAATFNALGFKVCRDFLKRKYININVNKTSAKLRFDIMRIKKDSSEEEKKKFLRFVGPISRLISLAKANAIHSPKRFEWEDLAIQYDISLEKIGDDVEEFYRTIDQTWKACLADTKMMDFDDQIYMPVRFNWPIPKFDYVFVDEVQDINKIQMQMLERLVA